MKPTESYVITKWELSGNLTFDITSENLIYTDCGSHHGLQCNFKGGTPRYEKIQTICDDVVILMKKIEIYNNWNKDEIVTKFSKKYDLTLNNWIDNDVADFKFYVFTVDQMVDCILSIQTFSSKLI